MAKSKKTSQAAESSNIPTADELQSQALVPRSYHMDQPSNIAPVSKAGMFAMTVSAGRKVKKLTMPPIVKPSEVGPGVGIEGIIVKVINSPVSTYKSKLLVMRHPGTEREFCWPVNSVTERALAAHQDVDKDDIDYDELTGVHLTIVGMGSTRTQDGKRDVRLFEISVIED